MWSNKPTTLVCPYFLHSVLAANLFGGYYGIVYGLAAAVFTQNLNRAIETAHKLQAGTAWVSFFALSISQSKKANRLNLNLNFFPRLQGQLCQPLKRTSSFRWIQTIWYWTWNGRICSCQVRYFFPPLPSPSFTHCLPLFSFFPSFFF